MFKTLTPFSTGECNTELKNWCCPQQEATVIFVADELMIPQILCVCVSVPYYYVKFLNDSHGSLTYMKTVSSIV